MGLTSKSLFKIIGPTNWERSLPICKLSKQEQRQPIENNRLAVFEAYIYVSDS